MKENGNKIVEVLVLWRRLDGRGLAGTDFQCAIKDVIPTVNDMLGEDVKGVKVSIYEGQIHTATFFRTVMETGGFEWHFYQSVEMSFAYLEDKIQNYKAA